MSDSHGVDKDRRLPTQLESQESDETHAHGLGVVVLTGALAGSLGPSTPLGAGLLAQAQQNRHSSGRPTRSSA